MIRYARLPYLSSASLSVCQIEGRDGCKCLTDIPFHNLGKKASWCFSLDKKYTVQLAARRVQTTWYQWTTRQDPKHEGQSPERVGRSSHFLAGKRCRTALGLSITVPLSLGFFTL